jgi:MFS family permease
MLNPKRNIVILLSIIILDFMGFTLIFPLIPDLLIYYLNHPLFIIDEKIINLFHLINTVVKKTIALNNNLNEGIVLIIGGVLSSIYSLLQFIFLPFWGKLSDIKGRKRILIYTSLGLSISYLFWFFSKSFFLFILSRIIGGIMAGNLGVAAASMADISTENKRTIYMGLVGMAFGLGFILGPIFGGILYFIGNEYFKFLYQYEFFHPFSICALGSFLLSLMSVLMNLFFLEETYKPEIKDNSLKSIFSFNQLNKNIKILIFLNLIYMLIFTSYEFTFTFFYKFTFNLSPKEIGYVFFYLGILIALGQGILPRIFVNKIKEITMIRIGIILLSFTFLLQPILNQNIIFSLISLIPLSIGNSFFQPAINSYVSLLCQKNEQGYILSLMRSLGSLSRAIGPIIGGSLYWLLGIQITYLIFILTLIPMFFLTFLL